MMHHMIQGFFFQTTSDMTSVQQRDALLDACMVVIIIKSIVDIAFHHQKNIIHADGIYSYACGFVSLPLLME